MTWKLDMDAFGPQSSELEVSYFWLPQEAVHGLCDVRSVDSVVVGVVAVVVLLDHDQEPPEFDHVQLKELHQAILV